MDQWDFYTRQSLDLASSAAAFGFGAAKASTRLGFHVTRGILNTAGAVTSTVVDHAFFGGNQVATPAISGAVAAVMSLAEHITLAPIFLGEYITATSITAAHSSVNALAVIIPGSHEASFSLVAFIGLVKQEWASDGAALPAKPYNLAQITRGIIGWVSLQGVTQEWQEKNFFKHLKEIHVRDPPRSIESLRARRGSRVRVTSDVIFPGEDRAQIIAADIGEARALSLAYRPSKPRNTKIPHQFLEPQKLSNAQLKATLRRLSKMVLYGYGGASLLFFGVPLTTPGTPPAGSPQARSEEAQMARAINASEREAEGDLNDREPPQTPEEYSWWDVLLGKHDEEIFSTFNRGKRGKTDVVIGQEHLMPRFWVLTDHSRAQVVLVIRGTMSLNEIAVDLTCDTVDFQPARTGPPDTMPIPGRFAFPTVHEEEGEGETAKEGAKEETYQVHSGILRMAKAMGDLGRPVQVAVQEALFRNPEYDLVMCGHSLGAGVAAMLGLMWADTSTCRTVTSSGLPVGRRTSVYCFAPPCITDIPLALKAKDLIVSFVYSHDVVARLSIGTVTDIRNAAAWLCDAHEAASVTAPEGAGSKESGHTRRRSASEGSAQRSTREEAAPVLPLDTALLAEELASSSTADSGSPGPSTAADAALTTPGAASTSTSSLPPSSTDPSKPPKTPKPNYAEARKPKAERTDSNFEKSTFEGRNCGHLAVTDKAWRWRKGWGKEGDEAWFIALRKTLEANMQHPKKLYPAGRLLWALRDSDLCEVHREGAVQGVKPVRSDTADSSRSKSSSSNGKSSTAAEDKLRLFEVEDREKTFSQILFAKDMLSAHLPHKYDTVLHDLL